MFSENIIVGAGLAGSTIARLLADKGHDVLIVDKRDHIGGNIYDYRDENGILVHKYGPHIFHTDNQNVWKYLSKFTDWYPYFHKVEAVIDGINIPIPFNLNSLYKVFTPNLASSIEDKLINKYGFNAKIPILDLKNSDDGDFKFLADYVYKKVFLGYTLKQWGLSPEELDKSVTSRIPIYISRDDRYFQDKYQGIPENGYTEMIKSMLDHPLINVRLNTDFNLLKNEIKFKRLIYTGAIDEFFDYKFGELPYRSMRFDFKEYNTQFFQAKAQVNYPENYDFTRITEFKHFLNTNSEKTKVAYEYPEEYHIGKNDQFYPIPNEKNADIYKNYLEEAKKLNNTVFLGRLGEYKYYNMDQIVEESIKLFNTLEAAK